MSNVLRYAVTFLLCSQLHAQPNQLVTTLPTGGSCELQLRPDELAEQLRHSLSGLIFEIDEDSRSRWPTRLMLGFSGFTIDDVGLGVGEWDENQVYAGGYTDRNKTGYEHLRVIFQVNQVSAGHVSFELKKTGFDMPRFFKQGILPTYWFTPRVRLVSDPFRLGSSDAVIFRSQSGSVYQFCQVKRMRYDGMIDPRGTEQRKLIP